MLGSPRFRALYVTFLRLDFRRARAGGQAVRQRELSTPARLVISFLFQMLMGVMVGMTSLVCTDRRTYAAIVLGYALTMLGMLILMEFGVSVVQSEDLPVLGPRPVPERTYAWAKIANLATFVAFYGTAVSLGPVALAVRYGGAFSALLAAAIALGTAAAGGILLSFYGFVLRRVSPERSRDLLNWAMILFSVAVPVLYMLLSRWMDRGQLTVTLPLERRPWMQALPPVWLAGGLEWLLGARDSRNALLAALSALVVLVAARSWMRLGQQGLFRLSALPEGRPGAEARRNARGLRWLRPLFATPAEWGVFRLLLTYLRRDRGTRARLYPQFGMSIAFFLVAALQDGFADPWNGEGREGMAFLVALYPALTCAWVPLLLRFTEQWEAAWAFAVAPGATLADLSRALHRATLLLVVAPLFAMTWGFFLWQWGNGLHALLHVLPPFLGAVALMDVALIWRRPVPLSTRYVKGETGTRLALTFTLLLAFLVLGGVQQAAAGSLPLSLLLLAVELTAVFGLDWVLTETLTKRSVVLADL